MLSGVFAAEENHPPTPTLDPLKTTGDPEVNLYGPPEKVRPPPECISNLLLNRYLLSDSARIAAPSADRPADNAAIPESPAPALPPIAETTARS